MAKPIGELPHEIRYTQADAVMSAVGATLLIVSEMLGAVAAFAWAIAGLFGFGTSATVIIIAVVMVPGLWFAFSLTRRILRVERHLRAQA